MIFRRQLPVYSPLTLGAVAAAARTMVSGPGAEAAELERLLRGAFGSAAVVLTDSGTSALTLALRASSAGRAVALPAYGCYDLATAADGAEASILLYDVDPHTLCPDLVSLEAALKGGAGVVVVAAFFGVPIDLDAVTSLAHRHGAVIVEDAAQGIGMTWRGRVAGSMGAFGVLSFGRGKGVTGGGGGALLLRDTEAVAAFQSSNPAIQAPARASNIVIGLLAQCALARPSIYALPSALPLGLGQTHYRTASPPRRIAAPSCAAVLRTWPLGPDEVALRRVNAARLLTAAQESPRLRTVSPVPGGEASFLRLPLIASAGEAPFAAHRAARLGIMPGYPLALADLAGFVDRVRNRSLAFPGARELAARLGTLPTHTRLRESDLQRLERWLTGSA